MARQSAAKAVHKRSIWTVRLVVSVLVGISIWNSLNIDENIMAEPHIPDVPNDKSPSLKAVEDILTVQNQPLTPPRKVATRPKVQQKSRPSSTEMGAKKSPAILTAEAVAETRTAKAPFKQAVNNSRTSPSPVRVLLGIESERVKDKNPLKRRRLARTTYLDFDRVHRPDQPNRVCTLQEYMSSPNDWQHCRLLYTFLVGPKNVHKKKGRGAVLSPMAFQNLTNEQDLLYLNVDVKDRVGKRWSWFRYVSSLPLDVLGFPLIAYTDCQVLLQLSIFWEENPLFHETIPSKLKGIYGGMRVAKKSCDKDFCASLTRNTFMDNLSMLSSDLVQHLAVQPIPALDEPRDSSDVAIANGLVSYKLHSIHEVDLRGLEFVTPRHPTSVFLEFFVYSHDNYKDTVTNYTDPVEEAMVLSKHPSLRKSARDRKARVLLGIFSMDSPEELERRHTIRDTYLQAFVNSITPHRICSLGELGNKMQEKDKEECEIAYAFIVGGNHDGPTELVDATEERKTGPVAIPIDKVPEAVRLPDHDKGDIVYLNIKENMEDGKSPTYFKFAVTLIDDQHYFDYIAKTDTDTLVYPETLLEKVIYKLPKFPDNVRVYAGHYAVHPTIEPQLGPAYMEGRFYMMSPDLARFVTSSACNRSAVDTLIEDMSMGNFVHSHPKPIQRKGTVKNQGVFDHPLKDVNDFRARWNNSLATRVRP